MNVLMINGSPRVNGNTAIALREMEQIFKLEGIDCECVQIGMQDVRGCIACGSCAKKWSTSWRRNLNRRMGSSSPRRSIMRQPTPR